MRINLNTMATTMFVSSFICFASFDAWPGMAVHTDWQILLCSYIYISLRIAFLLRKKRKEKKSMTATSIWSLFSAIYIYSKPRSIHRRSRLFVYANTQPTTVESPKSNPPSFFSPIVFMCRMKAKVEEKYTQGHRIKRKGQLDIENADERFIT